MLDKRPASIQRMFADVAHRYDRANRVLSMRLDVSWRRAVARTLLPAPGLVLDLAAGTGDLTVDLTRRGGHTVISGDFTFEMLAWGTAKLQRLAPTARQVCADALNLPFADESFDGTTVSFGIRNFSDPLAGLSEMKRILKRGGVAGILEFSRPSKAVAKFYDFYSSHFLPRIGGAITGSRAPYEYLPASVRQFPEGEAFLALMREAGFVRLTAKRFTFGIATFYRGEKA